MDKAETLMFSRWHPTGLPKPKPKMHARSRNQLQLSAHHYTLDQLSMRLVNSDKPRSPRSSMGSLLARMLGDLATVATFGIANNKVPKQYVMAANSAEPGGSGPMVERAHQLIDKVVFFRDVQHLGPKNTKNGPDLIVNRIPRQTKYYARVDQAIRDCLDDKGNWRYGKWKGRRIRLECPRGSKQAYIERLKKLIRDGRVPGIKDPRRAKDIVVEGCLTHQQASNLALPWKMESMICDTVTGLPAAGVAWLMSTTIRLVQHRSEGNNLKTAAIQANADGALAGGTTLAAGILSSQLARTGFEKSLNAPTRFVLNKCGNKIVRRLATGLGKSGLSGAAATNYVGKVLRGNVAAAVVTTGVLAATDLCRMANGKITGAQALKNIISGGAGTIAGTAGSVGGALLGSVIPVIGTGAGAVVGGMVGNVAMSYAATSLVCSLLNSAIKDESPIRSRSRAQLSLSYPIKTKSKATPSHRTCWSQQVA